MYCSNLLYTYQLKMIQQFLGKRVKFITVIICQFLVILVIFFSETANLWNNNFEVVYCLVEYDYSCVSFLLISVLLVNHLHLLPSILCTYGLGWYPLNHMKLDFLFLWYLIIFELYLIGRVVIFIMNLRHCFYCFYLFIIIILKI